MSAAQRDTARFWKFNCIVLALAYIVLIVAYAAGFIEHYFKGCNV